MTQIVRIALPFPKHQLFDYLVEDGVALEVGRCVRVPFAAGEKTGVVVAVNPPDAHNIDKLRAVREVMLDVPCLPAKWLALTEFASRYYQYPWGEVIATALPPGLRRAVHLPREDDPVLCASAEGRAALEKAQGEGKKITRPLSAVQIALTHGASRRNLLAEQLGETGMAAVRAARKNGWLEPSHARSDLTPFEPLPLNEEQAIAVKAVQASLGQYNSFLLHGVTGSGKTEVYLQLIAATLARGEQALMLVPEIGLTPQLLERVSARFPGARWLALHSALADGARSRGFIQALQGEVDIVLGTRLSVFVPLPKLGLIIVDEEHDPSFKQQEGLRYSARDLAVWRARSEGIPVLLGSATPALESWLHAKERRYTRLSMPRPAVAENPPTMRIVDTRRIKLDQGLTPHLVSALGKRVEAGEQSLVFLNRRGYAPVVMCSGCGWVSKCDHCSANKVFHQADGLLRCHHCGSQDRAPRACPQCGNQDIHAFGRGTQRLEERLTELLPTARILRVDRDAVRNPAQWQAVRDQIASGEADILVGTQMLAKGHDFPRLTLVGTIGADASLYSADYRAPERLFQQLMQVAGRSGRGNIPGEVIIQTEFPEHVLYQCLAKQDYAAFAEQELVERQRAGFPPYSYHAILRAEAPELAQAIAFLKQARQQIQALATTVRAFDPIPLRMVRRARYDRAQLVLEADSRAQLHTLLSVWVPQLYATKVPREFRWHLDIDPIELG